MKTTFAWIVPAAVLIGCASLPPYPTDPNQQAAYLLATAQRSFAEAGTDAALLAYPINSAAEKPNGIEQIKALFGQNPRMAEAYQAYLAKSCAEVDLTFKAVEMKRALSIARRIYGDDVANQLDAILERRVAEGNFAGTIPFLLDDDYAQFRSLNDPKQLRKIVDRTIAVLQTTDSSRRPTPALFRYVAQVGPESDEGKRISSLLSTMNLRREELPDAALVYPQFAGELEAKLAKRAQMPGLSVGDAGWKRLSQEQRDRVEAIYRVETFDSSRFARVVNVQGLNESTPGTNAGAQLGSAIGQAQYIDRSDWRNYSATGQLAAGILGAIIGGMTDRPPVVSYRLVYTLRDADGNIRTAERVSTSPIYVAPGLCIDTSSFSAVRDDQCDALPREVVEMMGTPSTTPPAVASSPTPEMSSATNSALPPVVSGTATAPGASTPPTPPTTLGNAVQPVSTSVVAPVPTSVVAPVSARTSETATAALPSPAVATGTSRHMFSAERFAKAAGCLAPVATMNVQTAAYETFTITCSNGDPLSIRCEGSGCRELK